MRRSAGQGFGKAPYKWLTQLGKMEGRRRRGRHRMRWLDDIADSMDMSLRKLGDIVKGGLAYCS